jgi:hypothetical protein
MSGGWPRGGAGRKSESSGAKHKSRAARVQARGRWRRAANNVARSETARRGSSQAQITGTKQGRGHDGRQGERPFAKLTLKPAVTWRGAVAAGLGRLKAATAGAAPQSHALPPSTVKEALARPDASEWVRAMEEEVQSWLRYDVRKEYDLLAGKQALPSRFVCERKRDGRYKACLVAGGHQQKHGLDFAETIAPVCSYQTMRLLLAVSAHENLVLRQFDVRTFFWNGELEEEVSLHPPSGAEYLPGGHKQALRLQRALYGLKPIQRLKQASRAWNKRLEGELRAKEFEQSDADPALWILHGTGCAVLAMFYVDDGLVAAKIVAEADALVDLVGSMFEIRKIEEPMADKLQYQRVVGSLLHLAQCTRPDIALPVAALATYSSAPSTQHYAVLLDIARYVGGTASRGSTYGGKRQPLGFWCDANFAACKDTRRSTTGFVVTMYEGAVSWSSKKQATTAASTMDAEYQACGAAAREGMSLRKTLGGMALLSADFLLSGPVTIRCDNKAALSLCKDRKEG